MKIYDDEADKGFLAGLWSGVIVGVLGLFFAIRLVAQTTNKFYDWITSKI